MSLLQENPQRVTRQMRTDYEVVDVGMMKDMWKKAKEKGKELYEKGKKGMQKIAKNAGEAIDSLDKSLSGRV